MRQVESFMTVPKELESINQLEDVKFEGKPVSIDAGMGQPIPIGSIDEVNVMEKGIEVSASIDAGEDEDAEVVEMLESGEAKLAGHFVVDFDEEQQVVESVNDFITAIVVPDREVEKESVDVDTESGEVSEGSDE